MIEPQDWDQQGVSQGFDAIMDLLLSSGLNKAESVVAMLNVIGVQYAGITLADDDARVFVEQASTWIEQYFKELALD